MTRTLVITAGETPQVVTETVWALARLHKPWRPDHILLATTASGAALYQNGRAGERAVPPLLGTGGRLAILWSTLWPKAPLPEVRLLVAEQDGQPLPDLRTAQEVRRFAEMLLAELATITADPASELHLSLAGGRKTMSFIAGQVMSLLGRAQDRLSHVLVEPAKLERNPDFWWPGDGSSGADEARVLLHDVPYLRVRAWVDPEQAMGLSAGYAAVVDRANRELAADHLMIDLASRTVQVAGAECAFNPREMALLAMVAIARKRALPLERTEIGRDAVNRPENVVALDGDVEGARRLWAWLFDAANGPGMGSRDNRFDTARDEAAHGFNYGGDFGQPASRVRRKLRENLTERTAMRVLAPDVLLTLFAPENIKIIGSAELADDPDRPPEVDCKPAV